MRIAIIGTGRVGSALAGAFARAGHQVVPGSRHPEPGTAERLPADAAAWGEVVVLALPWDGATAAVRALGPLTGKIVIDCMNPIARGPSGMALALGHDTSGGETVQGWLPGARVVKTLNQVGAEVMADTSGFAHPPVMFMAGDDAAAKTVVTGLLADLGFEPLDAGDITKARLLEPFGMVWINQAIMRGKGRNWAFAVTNHGD